MSGPADYRGHSGDDGQAQYWLAVLQSGSPDEKAAARRGLAAIFEARGMDSEAVELLVTNARDGYRDVTLFQALARIYRRLGDEYLAASAALEATRLSEQHQASAVSGAATPGARHSPGPRRPVPPPRPPGTRSGPRPRPGSPPAPHDAPARAGDPPGSRRSGVSPWRRPLPIAGWITVLATAIAAAGAATVNPASTALYLVSAGALAVLLIGSGPIRRLVRVPDGPLGDGALVFLWLLALLAGGSFLPRNLTMPRQPAQMSAVSTPSPYRTPSSSGQATSASIQPTAAPTAHGTPVVTPTPLSERTPAQAEPVATSVPTVSEAPSPISAATAPPVSATPYTAPDAPPPDPPSVALAPPSAAPAANAAIRVVVANAGPEGVRLRASPGSGETLKVVADGAPLETLGGERNEDGRAWLHVRDGDGVDGWVAADYLADAPPGVVAASMASGPQAGTSQASTSQADADAVQAVLPEARATPPAAPTASSAAHAGQATPRGRDCPDSHPIKGNVASSGELIYHPPGGAFYTRTNPEACFATATDARAAGYRASLR